VLLADDFRALDKSWDSPLGEPIKPLVVESGKLKVKAASGQRYLTLYRGKAIDNADICVTVQTPTSYDVNKPDDATIGGVVFLAQDEQNWHAFVVETGGAVALVEYVDGQLRSISSLPVAGLVTSPGSKNRLHVNMVVLHEPIEGEAVSMDVNGKTVLRARYGKPKGGSMVGLLVEAQDAQANEWKFLDLKVTEAPR
jgi:hypothetical protein